ncbi:hypothetical protein CH373_06705 [Leptospira perolatii]|uniref:Leucine-rich repeat domain-containing protein n=1 Tax=Leptospira perolatii TaxID=2023191 RepID=A0A2M9ZP27_9LEPT|nr:leucine-rich repeat domain-containing protein [Leptospira perolatii]PJZ70629.1 hypothetical protein CH360_03565 [Leptospira perolatii]PJZ73840.1 hypothetical protein CH373_06705 [Leptospira perolatii]
MSTRPFGLLIIVFLSLNCKSSQFGIPVSETSGEILGQYHPETRWIGFTKNQNPKLSELSHFPNLEILELSSSEIESIDALPELPKLRFINLNHTNVKRFEVLEKFPKLDSLILNGTQVDDSDLALFHSWNRLTRLELNDTKVTNLNFLVPGCSLRRLHLRHTKIEDISPVSNCVFLKELYLGGTLVQDLKPLASVSGLYHLQLDGTNVSNEEIASLRKQLPYLKIFPGLRKIFLSETGQ